MNSGSNSGFIWVIVLCVACGYAMYCVMCRHGIAHQLRPGDALELFVMGSCGFVYAESFLLYAGARMRPWHLPAFLTLLVVICLWHRCKAVPVAWKRSANATSRALALLTFALAAVLFLDYMLLSLNNSAFDIDMLSHILIKGKILANEGLWDSPYLNDPMFANMHSRYPLFAPVIYGNFYQWGPGNANSYLFTNFLLVGAIAAALYSWLRNSLSPWMSALWSSIYVSSHGFLNSVFIMSSMEIMLTAVFFCAVRHFYQWKTTGDSRELSLAAAFAGMAMLVKNDALLFSLALLATAAMSGAGRTLWRPTAIWAAIASPWFVVSRMLPDAASGPSFVLRNASLAASLPHVRVALAAIERCVIEGWSGAFLIAAIVFGYLLFRKNRPPVFWLLAVGAITILGYCVIIWLYVGMVDSFEKTLYRLLSALYPLALACIALALDSWAKQTTAETNRPIQAL